MGDFSPVSGGPIPRGCPARRGTLGRRPGQSEKARTGGRRSRGTPTFCGRRRSGAWEAHDYGGGVVCRDCCAATMRGGDRLNDGETEPGPLPWAAGCSREAVEGGRLQVVGKAVSFVADDQL